MGFTYSSQVILVVEDDFSIREMMSQVLEDEGYRVATAANGLAALNYLQNNRDLPNLIVLDLKMPIMDGAEFRKRQQQDARLAQIPVLVLTADHNSQKDPSTFAQVRFLAKPVKLDALIVMIRQSVG